MCVCVCTIDNLLSRYYSITVKKELFCFFYLYIILYTNILYQIIFYTF